MLRICWLAASLSDCAISGKSWTISGCSAACAIDTSAPSRSPRPSPSIRPRSVSLSALISTSDAGRMTSSFIRSISVVPPARKWTSAPLRSAAACTAASGLVTDWYANGRMTLPRLRHDRLGLFDGRDDVRIGRATTDVPAHILADVGVFTRVPLLYAGDRGKDLAGGTVSALERVVGDEGL